MSWLSSGLMALCCPQLGDSVHGSRMPPSYPMAWEISMSGAAGSPWGPSYPACNCASKQICYKHFYPETIVSRCINITVLWKVGVDTFHNTSCLLWTLPPSVLLFLASKTTAMRIQDGRIETYISLVKPGCSCVSFCCTYTKIGTIQRRLAWPLRKDDTQIREAFLILNNFGGKYEEKVHISQVL